MLHGVILALLAVAVCVHGSTLRLQSRGSDEDPFLLPGDFGWPIAWRRYVGVISTIYDELNEDNKRQFQEDAQLVKIKTEVTLDNKEHKVKSFDKVTYQYYATKTRQNQNTIEERTSKPGNWRSLDDGVKDQHDLTSEKTFSINDLTLNLGTVARILAEQGCLGEWSIATLRVDQLVHVDKAPRLYYVLEDYKHQHRQQVHISQKGIVYVRVSGATGQNEIRDCHNNNMFPASAGNPS